MRISRALLLTRKEWKESFNSPTPYIALVLFFVIMGWLFTASLFLVGQASLDEFLTPLPLLLAVFLPAFTMRLFAEEYKTGTVETLVTLPLEDAEIVLGKFGAALAIWGVLLGLSLVYLALLIVLGPPDLGQAAGGFLGALLLGIFYSALGLFASSLSRSQVVGFLLGFLLCFVFFLVGQSAEYLPGLTGRLLSYFGVDRHYQPFLKGIVDTRDVLYFLSGTVLALAGTLASFNSRRWR
ncbi:MAG: ABC transporter permease subunit [Elusimicrobia bacterium]|nr:ABC transporter permease subunit [Elusimicrobiota bacterium]MBK7207717.1 ABC transporter permease subunit [Elusimicrobiota bacterium]MBK7544478.1 ABC transporter permease subunit [Elusimicrobiota bacterium]MBK7574001.1 ABC transporter permease subunit [Elusimicrobiota bacterium]MBK7689050.1 ABC transporter permease subunit [Elusimicrobiota bacterium]